MATQVETMFYTREKPWHGLGRQVKEAPTSKEALILAGLDWKVLQEPIFTEFDEEIKGFKANVRNTDRKILGVVSDRYRIVQNEEGFAFTDALLGEGVKFETAGSLMDGRKVWMLARMPQEFIITGERISPYMVFSNSHDGTAAVKVAMTPIRVVCNNTLNIALNTAKRSWSQIHTGDIQNKVKEAHDTLFLAEKYMDALGREIENLRMKKLTEKEVMDYIEILLPIDEGATLQQRNNILKLQNDCKMRYFDAPDLKELGHNAYRFVNAVSDFATHSRPLRVTSNYKENIFDKTVSGNPMIDQAYRMMLAV